VSLPALKGGSQLHNADIAVVGSLSLPARERGSKLLLGSSLPLLHRRAEAKLWQEQHDGATVRRFVGEESSGPLGRLALARVLMSEGDRDAAARQVRAVWCCARMQVSMPIRC
jgi:hypothetical protein